MEGAMLVDVESLSFKTVLRLHTVDGHNGGGPIVRYEIIDAPFLATRRGVYVVTSNDVVVYCGTFTNTFAKRWLYTRGEYVYHFKRGIIAETIVNHEVFVHAQSEECLREQIGQPGNEWVSVTSIEEKLIRDLKPRPIWNIIGHRG